MAIYLKKIGLILLSSLLLFASWPPSNLGPIVFFALIPLLFYVDSISVDRSVKKYFLQFSAILTTLFCFGFLTALNAWGEYNRQSFIPILMCFVPLVALISFYGLFKNKKLGFLFLIFGWGTMELFQMNWDMNSPLLMLGNSLSYFPSIIQHYSIWGVTGGSMYIVAVNVVLFSLLKSIVRKESFGKKRIASFLVFLPIVWSVISFNVKTAEGDRTKVAMVLGHFEHFTEENSLNPFRTIDRYNELISNNKGINEVEAVFFPESAVVNSGWIENLNRNDLPNPLDSLCAGKQIFFGSHVFSIYNGDKQNKSYNVNFDQNSGLNYLKHNCSIYRSRMGRYTVKSKDKFVSFHEIKPYPTVLGFLADILNKEAVPTYLSPYEKSSSKPVKLEDGTKVHSIMCFESFFSDVIVKQPDADFIAVLANESWNYQNKGKEQYFSYMIPKAIESGKSILKVSNCGYSGYINSKGQIKSKVDFEQPSVKVVDVELTSNASFYSVHFSEIRVFILLITGFLFVYLIVWNRRKA